MLDGRIVVAGPRQRNHPEFPLRGFVRCDMCGRPLREELTLAQIDHHADAVGELDVQGILAFAEWVLPRTSDLWVQASLDYKQRLQQFFPEGIAYDEVRFNRTAVTAPLFNYLAPDQSAEEILVSREGIEPSTRRLRVCCSAN